MTVPVVVCDDSSFARRQIARALPQGWDVAVTFAANGLEALDAIRQGEGDVLFLDLTMPEMDGFQVLEAIRREDLNTLTIVVSGDIQPESRRRVQQLGAVAFIQKPVDGEALAEVLDDYGVLGVLDGGALAVDAPVGFTDWCQEVANVAMGQAADLLAKLAAGEIELSVPRVELLPAGRLEKTITEAVSREWAAVVSQGFIGSHLAGETLLVFDDTDMAALAEVMHYEGQLEPAAEMELLTEIANVLVGAFLKGLFDQLGIGFSQGHPRIHLPDSYGSRSTPRAHGHSGLCIRLSYHIGARRVHCEQLVLFPERSISSLEQRAQYAIA